MEKRLLWVFLVLGMLLLNACEDESIPNYNISEPSIDVTDYTGSPVTFLYSIDNGINFSSTPPADIREGRVLLVKLNDGVQDLTKEDYIFDWSESSPKPTSSTSDLGSFTLTSNASIKVKLTDVEILVAGNKNTGKLYSVNPSTGGRIEIFTPTYNGAPLTDLRAFAYHAHKNSYFASVSALVNGNPAGYLYSIDPFTKEATRINENNGGDGHEKWEEVSNWLVAADDSLLSVGNFAGEGGGLVKFGTSGARGNKTINMGICCGLGMTWGADENELVIADGTSLSPGEVRLNVYSTTGQIKTKQVIRNFVNFPDNLAADALELRTLVKDKKNQIYGLLYDNTTGRTYFVGVFQSSGKITYISRFGESSDDQYSSMAFIPKHFLF